jgi:hypothetical protein
LKIWIVEPFGLLVDDTKLCIGKVGLARFSLESQSEGKEAILGDLIMSIGCTGHRADPTVDVLAFGPRDVFAGKVILDRDKFQSFGAAHRTTPK